MKRYMLIVGLLAAISCALMVPAFAVGSDPVYSVTDAQTPLSAPALTPSQSLLMSAGETEVPTVNISDESVQAIADAVNLTSGQVTSKAGVTYDIPPAALPYWSQYKYHIVYNSGGILNEWHFVDNVEPYSDAKVRASAPGVRVYGSTVYDYANDLGGSTTMTYTNVLWSDVDLYSTSGDLLYAADVQTERAYTIEFKTGFPDLDATLPSASSDAFALPEVAYSGYVFRGWYLDADYVIPFPDGYEFKQDTILYAKWSKVPVVSFVTGVDGLTYEDQYANVLTLPRPSCDGSVFIGWYLDSEFTEPFSLGMEITEDITLYAKWTESLPMSFFATSVFDSLTVITECQPIFYLISIGALGIVLAILKRFMDSRTC